jgi:hypothetical protein
MIETILISAVVFVICFYAAGGILTLWLRWRINRMQRELGDTLGQLVHKTIEEHTIIMRIEHDADYGYFAYREADGEFLAHGDTIETLMDNFAQRFPNKTGLVPNREGSGQEHLRSFMA